MTMCNVSVQYKFSTKTNSSKPENLFGLQNRTFTQPQGNKSGERGIRMLALVVITALPINNLRKTANRWEYLGSGLSATIVACWQKSTQHSIILSTSGTLSQSKSRKQSKQFAFILSPEVSNSIGRRKFKKYKINQHEYIARHHSKRKCFSFRGGLGLLAVLWIVRRSRKVVRLTRFRHLHLAVGQEQEVTASNPRFLFPSTFFMEFLIDLGSFFIEAPDEKSAYLKAREMIESDSSWVEIDSITTCQW